VLCNLDVLLHSWHDDGQTNLPFEISCNFSVPVASWNQECNHMCGYRSRNLYGACLEEMLVGFACLAILS
jgi:hypothetical protein